MPGKYARLPGLRFVPFSPSGGNGQGEGEIDQDLGRLVNGYKLSLFGLASGGYMVRLKDSNNSGIQPGVDQPGVDQPGVDQPGVIQPGVIQAGDNLPGSIEPAGIIQADMMLQPAFRATDRATEIRVRRLERFMLMLVACVLLFAGFATYLLMQLATSSVAFAERGWPHEAPIWASPPALPGSSPEPPAASTTASKDTSTDTNAGASAETSAGAKAITDASTEPRHDGAHFSAVQEARSEEFGRTRTGSVAIIPPPNLAAQDLGVGLGDLLGEFQALLRETRNALPVMTAAMVEMQVDSRALAQGLPELRAEVAHLQAVVMQLQQLNRSIEVMTQSIDSTMGRMGRMMPHY